MRATITVYGHLTVDRIFQGKGSVCESVGGPPAYGGLTALKLGHRTRVVTRFGRDIQAYGFREMGLGGLSIAEGSLVEKPTTRFEIHYSAGRRRLRLLTRCSSIGAEQLGGEGCDVSIVSPVCGEVSVGLLRKIKAISSFLYLDPQGFLRVFDSRGWVFLRAPRDGEFLRWADALKVDMQEAAVLTGRRSPGEALRSLLKRGPSCVVYTLGGRFVYLATGRGIWRAKPLRVEALDPTGAGDIFSAAFASTMASDQDPLWAVSRALAAVGEVLGGRGLRGLEKVARWRPSLEGAEGVLDSVRRVG